jgi:hypothetical protein
MKALQTYPHAAKSLARPGRKQARATEDFDLHILFIIIIGGILVLFIYITRLASNEIFSPSNKIYREVGRAKDLSAPLYFKIKNITVFMITVNNNKYKICFLIRFMYIVYY